MKITANALIHEAWVALERSDNTTAKQLGQDALELSRSIEPVYSAGCAHSLIVLGEAARFDGQYGSAIAYVMEAELLYEDLPSDLWLARGLYIIGYSYEHLGNESEALRKFHAQFDVAHQINSETYKATALRRIGKLHFKRNQLDIALEYYEKCLEHFDSTDDKTGIGGVFVDMSELYFAQGDYQKALEFAELSLQHHTEKNLIAPLALSHSSLARIYLAQDNKEQANYHITEALKFAQQSEHLHPQLVALKTISIIQRDMELPHAALQHLQTALQLAIRADDLFEGSEIHRLLAETYADLNQYDAAYQHHKEFHHIREMLWNEGNKNRFESLEILYQTRQAQAEANLQRELRQQDRHYYEKLGAIKDDFISHTTHDLKNPLASLSLTTDVLERHGRTDDAKGKELLNRTRKIIEQMRDLIANVLDLARIETGKTYEMQKQDFVAFVQDVLNDQHLPNAEAKNIQLIFETELEKQNLQFDAKPMEQLINNLVSNAIKYTPENGVVRVTISLKEDSVETTVSDTGIGIPDADLPHIFERFYRVDKDMHRSIEGTGLGLAICKSIIEQHGGTITVESTEGQGSTFRFTLALKHE